MADQPEPAVLVEYKDAVAWLTLNRPQVMNAINQELRAQLPVALRAADADPAVRVIVIRGAGERAFCAGADIKEFADAPSPAQFHQARRQGHWVDAFDAAKKPVIAAIHGFCLGGGLEMALACDIRIAADDASFALPEVSRGTLPGAGGMQFEADVRALLLGTEDRREAGRAFREKRKPIFKGK